MLEQFDHSLIEDNDVLLLAVSGGIDSMVMLHYLASMKNKKNIKMAVAHFDHQVREESFLDRQLVVDTCRKLSIHVYTANLTSKKKVNFQDFARQERYAFLVEKAKDFGASKIVLAHHANDLAETILMRLVRGSSFEGYRGMLSQTDYQGLLLIRPLLKTSREDIENYQQTYRVPYREDKSNLGDDYTRNRFRHHIMPLLEAENPKFLEKFCQFADYQSMAYDLIMEIAANFISRNIIRDDDALSLPIVNLKQEKDIIQIEIIKQLINDLSDDTIELSYRNLQDIVALTDNPKPHVEYPYNDKLYIHKSYDQLYFRKNRPEADDFSFVVKSESKITLPDESVVIITKNPNKYDGIIYKLCYNNLDLILPLTIRNRKNGDKVETLKGTKKIKDLLIDKKIPMSKRQRLPVVLNRHQEILWMPTVYQQKSKGKEILYLIYQEAINHA